MPLIQTELPHRPTFQVGAYVSIAIELEWALAAGENAQWRSDHPTLAAIYEGNPELHASVRGIWGPDVATSCGGFMELMVLAHRGGHLLSDDADALLDDLERLCTLTYDATDLPMVTESDEDRRVVLLRIERLSSSAEFRARYVAVVRAMWEAVRGDWERFGRGAVTDAVETRRRALAKGTDWHEVARWDGCDFGDLLEESVAMLGPDDELAVVPAFFTHNGLLFDLPGVLVAGVRTDTTGVQARARTEALARRLKAISDPTRLAILDALRQGPRTITELAATFSLAQPTVSNHVRILRDAGLVDDERDGTRRNLVVRPDAAEDLVSGLTSVLATRAAPAPEPAHAGA